MVATMRAIVFIVIAMRPTQAQRVFQAPPGREDVVVSIRQAGTEVLAFVAVALVGGEDTKEGGGVDVAGVEYTAQEVGTDEVAVEGFAEPVAHFGLKHPVLPLLVVAKRKGVVVTREIDRPLRGKPCLYPEVQGGGRVVNKIALQSYIL